MNRITNLNAVLSICVTCIASLMLNGFAWAQAKADSAHTRAGQPHNVLFITVDDLRPELGCYGATHIRSPNIDRLARSGLLFTRAYCQQSVCNPSRTSLMTGRRPNTIGVTGNHAHFRTKHPDVVTLPQHFKNHGYHAAAIGKIYHGVFPDGASITKWDTMGDPPSWSVPAIRFGPRYYYTEDGIAAAKKVFQRIYRPKNPGADDWTQKLVFGPATESPDVPDSTLYDGQVADTAIKTLGALKTKGKPFFLAVGFIKPHSPYIAPKKYFDLYRDVAMPGHTEFPNHAPKLAGHGSGEIRRYTDQPAKGAISVAKQKRVRQAYYACVSYIDAQVGRVLGELERLGLDDNTIVVLFGDHGYHLGEHGLWGKTTNFELDTRVPLIARAPGMKAPGKTSASLVELVDLFPTLAELANLPIDKQLEGKSFAHILDQPEHKTKAFALSQYPRGNGLMGYSIRSATHRLTQWIHRQTGAIRETELYDYSLGLVETQNVAMTSPVMAAQLSSELANAFAINIVTESVAAVEKHAAKVQANPIADFENAAAGKFKELVTPVGRWKPVTGTTIIDNKHAKTGKQCLQLTGGTKTSVTLSIGDRIETTGVLTFWAERWTSRSPFSFRIEKLTDGSWKEIYNGDAKVRVGRAFLSRIEVPLDDAKTKQLRFTVKSPTNTGILIDDLRIAPARPQQIVSVAVEPFTLPVLVGNKACPLLKLKVETVGRLNPISITELQASLEGTDDLSDLNAVSAALRTSNANTQLGKTISHSDFAQTKNKSLVFKAAAGMCQLAEGSNTILLTCEPAKRANIDHKVRATSQRVTFSNGQSFKLQAPASVQRMGVAVRNRGDDGVHTYRIPGLATTNKGTLIGVYDIRKRTGGDLPGDIDVGMSRSTDGGRTWQPMQAIMDMGNDPKWRYDGVGDPAVLVDSNTGTIWVAATWSHGNRSWVGSGPGLKPEETGQLMLVRSDDDGVTWSKPINITKQVKKPEWCFILQGPGKGITMRDGTIVFAAQYQDPPDKRRLPHSTIIYSKDHGKTWQVGTGAFDDTTESQVVELEPGVLMLNCRYNRKSVRVVMTTRDMGKTWQKHETSERALIEPRSCMASLINVDQEVGKNVGGWLLFSNPNSTSGRHHITIKASADKGKTWPKSHRLLLDEERGAGYSCMSMIDAKTVGILYEGSQAHMTFQRIPLADLIRDSSKSDASANTGVEATQKKNLHLPQVFGDHMVLQADAEIPVWGHSKAGTQVTITLGKEKKTAKANAQGRWQVRLNKRAANASPVAMRVESGGEAIGLTDILIGEVWVCAGQSNMEWPLRQSAKGRHELATPDHPQLRLLNLVGGARGSSGSYTTPHLARLSPSSFSKGEWAVASAKSASSFSAVAWYFGRHLQKKLNVPVGLICPAVGGTPTESWIPREALERDPKLKGLVAGHWLDNERMGEFCRSRGEQNLLAAIQAGESIPGDDLGPNHSFKPGFMWSAGIRPLIPYAIRGAIWYQGESNAETPERVREHNQLFPLLINQWRQQWGQGDFPFLYVQLPALNRPDWPWFREGQRRTLSQVNNVGMAITIDTGHPTNVHPSDKQTVGDRLALSAIGTVYKTNSKASHSGPLFASVRQQGHSIAVTFHHIANALQSSDGRSIRHFEISSTDGLFHPAIAEITSKNTIRLTSPLVTSPQHVRYAWSPYPNPTVNLVNSDGLPASPFSSESDETLFVARKQNKGRAAKSDRRPNILLIVGEDHGCELSCYGDTVIKTPHIDRLAAQGMLFENGYVTQSVCSPSRSTLFTGLYPHQNGQLGLATHKYGWFKKWPTTYSLLKKAGYRTGLIGKTHVIPVDAVESFVDFRFQESSNFAKRKVADYAVKAGQFFRAGDEPFFMTVNYPDAHWPLQGKVDGLPRTQVDPSKVKVMPYIGGDTPRMRNVVRNYYDCMLRLDACVGQLLKHLDDSGKADNTLVIFVGDHGAQMARGKVTVYEGGMRVPFIARWPNIVPAGKRSSSLVSTIDLLPTFVDVAGTRAPPALPGRSLRPIFEKKVSKPFREYLACERNCDAANLTFPQRTIRDARYKLIHSPIRDREDPAARYYRIHGASHWAGCLTDDELAKASDQTKAGYARWLNPPEFQLYDLKRDPHEWKDLASDPKYAEIKQRMIAALKRWQAKTDDPLADPEKLQLLMKENDAVSKAKRRSPAKGWQYLKYLAPDSEQSIFRQRDIPAGVPRKGHAKNATKFGYRIPSLLVTKRGSILAFSERRLGLHDHAQNDIVLKRSTDDGKTWSDEIVAFEDGMNSINDPLTVQLENGRILLMFARFPYGRHARDAGWIKMADIGYDDPAANVLTFICHSDDDGLTWSKPVDISRQVKPPQLLNANTPGAMIQLSRGPHKDRVLTGLWGTLPITKNGKRSREWRNLVAYSDDNGVTWKRTEPLKDGTGVGFGNECQVAEASNGDVILISRNQGGESFRKKAISHDGGTTWSALAIDRGLPSVACMGAIIKGPVKKDGTWDLWASFPSNKGRKDGQLMVSKDHGKTWQLRKVIYGHFAYSALQLSPDQSSLLCLYETSEYRSIHLIRIAIDHIFIRLCPDVKKRELNTALEKVRIICDEGDKPRIELLLKKD